MFSTKKIVIGVTLVIVFASSVWVIRASKPARQYREKQETLEKVKSRQVADETVKATLIDLRPFINTKLNESSIDFEGRNMDNLAELPVGTNIYAGVPFDVEGSIQLMGGWLQDNYHREYQSKVENIPIHRLCRKIHLFHGDAYVPLDRWGIRVVTLVVHYADGTKREIALFAGQHSLDWWSPIYRSGINPAFWTNAPGTELAWIGSNPCIEQWNQEQNQDLNLCLYKTTFDNPQPNIEVSTLDYVSALTKTCPFLLGITVE